MISIQAAAAPALVVVVVVVVSVVNCVSQCVRPAEIVVVLAQVSARIFISDISDRTLFWFYLNYPVTRTAYTYSALLYANYSKERKKTEKMQLFRIQNILQRIHISGQSKCI